MCFMNSPEECKLRTWPTKVLFIDGSGRNRLPRNFTVWIAAASGNATVSMSRNVDRSTAVLRKYERRSRCAANRPNSKGTSTMFATFFVEGDARL
jgi:hypothetical protein